MAPGTPFINSTLIKTNNPGVGLQMTDRRIHQEAERIGPGPQDYNINHALTARESQNQRLSQRYKEWHSKHKLHRQNAERVEIRFTDAGNCPQTNSAYQNRNTTKTHLSLIH